MGKQLQNFIEEWANYGKPLDTDIHIMDISRNDEVLVIEMRYPPTRYKPISTDEFLELKTAVRCRSGKTLLFATDLANYNSGIISLKVASRSQVITIKK